MLQFICDYCGDLRQTGETWINGVAVENVGTQAARREVLIDPAWRRERAVLELAVHFCSFECKDNYLSELFNKPVTLLEVQASEPLPSTGRRVVRAVKKSVAGAVQTRTTKSRKSANR